MRRNSSLSLWGWQLCLGLAALLAPHGQAQIEMGGARIDVIFESQDSEAQRTSILNWVTTAARAVTAYYGRYPVSHATVRIRATAGDRIGSGHTFGTKEGAVIDVAVGRSTTNASFSSDWLLTHEMVHLAFPDVADQHHWIEEGIATYVEPIARVRIGNLTAEKVWSDVARDLPQGLPEPGDRGLDFTHTWGRTYWGGALFCFLADIEIHRRTANRKGLGDALRGILNAGGNITVEWDLERALKAGDAATGASVLQELYAAMRSQPHPVDLDDLWKQLGIERHGNTVSLKKDAPLAAARNAIMAGP